MIGQRIAQYEIVEELGKGGMATVYRAYDPKTDRFVALKIIHRDLARDPGGIDRFRREAQLISRLEHPHLLPVYDYSADHDPPYIVMRYLEGASLKDIIDSRLRLPLSEIAHLMRQICAALDYAHRKNIIHRDIKPGNIMVDQDGNAYLTDFGIARVTTAQGFTQTGFAVGTPGYMSPEQGYGLETIDHRADIYALGVMIFEMTVGSAPYSAPTPMAVLLKHLHDPIPSAHSLVGDLPDGIDEVIQKAMAKAPEDRYSTAKELSDALVTLAGGAASTDTPMQLKAAAHVAVDRIENERDESAILTLLSKFERERAGGEPVQDMPTPALPVEAVTPVAKTARRTPAPLTGSSTPVPPVAPRNSRRGLIGAGVLIVAVLLVLLVAVFVLPPPPPTIPIDNGTLIVQLVTPGLVIEATSEVTAESTAEASPEIEPTVEASLTSTLSPTPEPSLTYTPTLSEAEYEGTVQAEILQLETEAVVTAAAQATQTATLWTPTFTPDARLTAAARITSTYQANSTATQHANASATAGQILALTATADAWTATPSPTATLTLTPTPTLTFTPSATPTSTLSPTPSLTPTSEAVVIALTQAATPMSENADWSALYPQGFEQEFDEVAMVLVPVGCISMGDDAQGYAWNGVEYAPRVPDGGEQCFDTPFWIDKYEVFNEQFDRLDGVAATPVGFDEPRRPRETISWFEARDFCAVRDARLPTESEWEYAARGPDALYYPWGDDFDADNTVYESNAGGETAEVGTHPGGNSWVGAMDMGGNVWEWTGSWFAPYPYVADDGREDLADSSPNFTERILRGGAWGNIDLGIRSAGRGGIGPEHQDHFGGFRCVKDVDGG